MYRKNDFILVRFEVNIFLIKSSEIPPLNTNQMKKNMINKMQIKRMRTKRECTKESGSHLGNKNIQASSILERNEQA